MFPITMNRSDLEILVPKYYSLRLGQGKFKMSLEYLIRPESNEVLKRDDMDMPKDIGSHLKGLESGKKFLHQNSKRISIDYSPLDMTAIHECMQINK